MKIIHKMIQMAATNINLLAESVTQDLHTTINAYGSRPSPATFIYRVGVTRHITCEITGE